jgi:hypothetical protein
MPVIPALEKLKQENSKFKTSLNYIASPVSNKTKASWKEGGSERERRWE